MVLGGEPPPKIFTVGLSYWRISKETYYGLPTRRVQGDGSLVCPARLWSQAFKGGPKPSCLLFFRGDFKSNFRLSGIFVPVGQFFPASSSNRAAEVGVGVKWLGPRRLGKMAARSDAARQRPPRASTYFGSTTFGRNPAPLLPF